MRTIATFRDLLELVFPTTFVWERDERMPRDFADQTPGRWDGSGTISDRCPVKDCQFYGEYHRFSLHNA